MQMKKAEIKEQMKVVTSNKFIHADGLQNLSIKERKLLYIAISQCRINDKEFYEYRISAKEFADLMDIDVSNLYEEAGKIARDLCLTLIKCEDKNDKNNTRIYTVFSYIDYGKIGFAMKLNSDISELLLQLKSNFTQPLLEDFLRMKSPYSIAIWHLMQEKMKSKKPYGDNHIDFYLSLEELRQVTGTENKFIQLGQFKERVLDKAIREIKDSCSVNVMYKNVKVSRTVVGFDFTAYSIWCPVEKINPVYLGKRKI